MNSKNIDGALTIWQARDNVCSYSPTGETTQTLFLPAHSDMGNPHAEGEWRIRRVLLLLLSRFSRVQLCATP